MAGKLSTSWALVKSSADVLRSDKELLVFPILSGIGVVLVALTFIVPAAILSGGGGGLDPERLEGVALPLAFLFYLLQYSVIFFFNSALVGAALIRLDGGDPSVADGLRIALERFGSILGYAAIAATVGMVLRAVSERAGWVGRFVVGVVGLGWTLATYLAVPVLVSRDVGPVDAVKESASILKRTWGEQVAGSVGLGLAFLLMFGSLTLFAIPFLILAARLSTGTLVVGVALVAGAYVLLALVSSALQGIYAAALYRFATTGEVGRHFDAGVLSAAFVSDRRTW